MQPTQLSLLPEQFPPPPHVLLAQLPDPDVAEAIQLLARLVAMACAEGEVPGNE